MKKKILCAILCATMAAFTLAGCGGGSSDSSGSGSSTESEATDEAGDDAEDSGDSEAVTGDVKIGITIQDLKNDYWAGVMGKLEELMKEKGYDYTLIDCEDGNTDQPDRKLHLIRL